MFGALTPITKNLIILNVVVFVLSFFVPYLYLILPAYFPYSPNFRAWQVVTHMFMHGGIAHIVFNMLTLWSFGPVLEQVLRGKRFVILYFLSGLGGFLLYNLCYGFEVFQITSQMSIEQVQEVSANADLYAPDGTFSGYSKGSNEYYLLNSLVSRMLGASGAIFGVVAAFSALFPNSKLIFMFIPFPIKAKYLFPLIILGSVYLGINDTESNIAHFAHIGGAFVGFLLAKIWGKHLNRFYQ